MQNHTDVDGEKLPTFVYRNIPVSNHAMIADTLSLRAACCIKLGDIAEGRVMVEAALNIRKDLFGRKSLPTADSLFQLANLTQLSGVLSEAMSLHAVALDMRTQYLCADSYTLLVNNSSGLRRHQSMCDSLLAVGALKVVRL